MFFYVPAVISFFNYHSVTFSQFSVSVSLAIISYLNEDFYSLNKHEN